MRLTDAVWRADLYATVNAETGSDLPVTKALERAAASAVATPTDLASAVDTVLADQQPFIASTFVGHELMPTSYLLELYDRGQCLSELGHRRGPRELLERLANDHGHDEAILTLGLDVYTDPAEPTDAFASFIDRHRDHSWLLRTLAEADPSNSDKEASYERVLDGHEEAAAIHARYLAQSPDRDVGALRSFIARHPYPKVLVVLLDTEIQDDERRRLVRDAATESRDRIVEDALAHRRLLDRASDPAISVEDATELVGSDDSRVMLALAGNPHAPWAVLDVLSRVEGRDLARHIRNAARGNLEQAMPPPRS